MNNVTLPKGTCDCHVHVFGPVDRYPFDPSRVYTPGNATEAELDALHSAIGIERVVLVQPSVYGTDNSRMLDGLKVLGPRARAVAVIGPETSDADLAVMHAAGVRGVRVNVATHSMNDPAEAWRLLAWNARRIARLGWHVQVLTRLPVIAALSDRIGDLPVPLVIDHFGYASPTASIAQPGFAELCNLVRSGAAYVKLSAVERLAGRGRSADMTPFIRALVAANRHRVIFGTDWPHTGGTRAAGRPMTDVEPFAETDDAGQVATVWQAMPDDAAAIACFVANPAQLYDFPETSA